MENTKLPVDNAALDAAYIENEPDEFITTLITVLILQTAV